LQLPLAVAAALVVVFHQSDHRAVQVVAILTIILVQQDRVHLDKVTPVVLAIVQSILAVAAAAVLVRLALLPLPQLVVRVAQDQQAV
jgi:hypothetical protein